MLHKVSHKNNQLNRLNLFLGLIFSSIFQIHLNAEEFIIKWSQKSEELTFENAYYSTHYHYLPLFSIQKNDTYLAKNIHPISTRRIPANNFTPEQLSNISNEWQIKTSSGILKGKDVSTVEVLPFRKSGNDIEVLDKFNIDFIKDKSYVKKSGNSAIQYADNSFLSSGNWYKIGVEKNGVYRIDTDFLKKLGMDIQNINASEIKIYGHHGGMLPELSGATRTDDIKEIPIQVNGQGQSLEILAYLEGPESWELNTLSNSFKYIKNLYTEQKSYFITVSSGAGKRISLASPITDNANIEINTFNDYQHIEENVTNLLQSGRTWLGREIDGTNQVQYNFNFSNIISTSPANISLGIAAKSPLNNSTFQVYSNSTLLKNIYISAVGSSELANAANYSETSFSIANPSSNIPIQIIYSRPDFNSKAWPDYITLNVTRALSYNQEPLYFRSISSIGENFISQFNINNWNSSLKVWDISDLFNIQEISTNNGKFKSKTPVLKEFVAFQNPILTPMALGKINNQNLHALQQADYLIITRKSLLAYAHEIGNFHLQQEGLSYHAIDLEEIFNEFSSGNNDLSAVRNFVKMFYDRAASQPETAPKYLLLFGNGNYDNRDLGEYLLPSYQSNASFQTIETYVTDDYFGFLDDTEGNDVTNTTTHLLDIAIGRITVDNLEKAQHSVDKIKRYYSQSSYGSWLTQMAFMADDEDNNIHIRDANEVADIAQDQYLNYNISKIYLDAFKQQSVAGGQRYPDVNEVVNNKIFQGLFYLNFVGHGGTNGLTTEKVLTFDDINRWENIDKLFLFCTATCEFTRFDIPKKNSAGERILVKNNGGAIALVSTTRLVFSDKNRVINERFTRYLLDASKTLDKTLGEIVTLAKNTTNTRENNRKFALFGDPALKLAFPKNEIVTSEVRSYDVPTDTLKSLGKITIKGEVRENNNLAQNFNGIVNVIVYDKMVVQNTLSNDGSSPTYNFKSRNNILYKGRTQAKNGIFEITFIMPKDINYNYGLGKLSYYANEELWDAVGFDTTIFIGGLVDSIPLDNKGPNVDLYIDNENFVFGGIAGKNSTLYIQLEDENGINTSGTGIGHDITAILNEEHKNPINLNSFYEGEIGNYKKGLVKYPFNNLENGRYKIQVKAWDVLNNSGDGYTEFVVEDKAELALYYVLNYPNPFTTKTQFSFEHNRPGTFLDVKIEIYSVSGKLVKTLQYDQASISRRVAGIEWDGLDGYGDKIGKGVYIYKVTVKNDLGEKAYKYQKLVLLK
ncbi:MAG: type IX secretion system sortase PorU [Chitinophagales bacterium]|nr:type IX secretion system sortase PorU [Chitinophagales bacterium]MCZ2392926.1 type IX secretion system sortase PorU [Chitinophagales bacterium]